MERAGPDGAGARGVRLGLELAREAGLERAGRTTLGDCTSPWYAPCICLAALMIGAVATHVMHAEWGMPVLATAIMALAALRGWLGRDEGGALLRRHAPA